MREEASRVPRAGARDAVGFGLAAGAPRHARRGVLRNSCTGRGAEPGYDPCYPSTGMKRDRVLVIDGNPLDGAALRAALCERGFDAVDAATADGGLSLVPSFAPAAVLADASLPDCDGAALVTRLRELRSDAAVVVTTPVDRLDAAVSALRAGAESYLVRPLHSTEVAVVLEKALEKRSLRRDSAALRQRIRQRLAVAQAGNVGCRHSGGCCQSCQ